MKRLKQLIVSSLAVAALLVPVLVPVSVSAQGTTQERIEGNLSCGAQLDFSNGDCKDGTADEDARTGIQNLVTNIIDIISLIVAVIAVIMIMIGGLRYITSNGDSGQVGNAKNTILYAVVGLVVVALAQIIVRFVVDRASTSAE